jgi:hypothetical protein
MTLDEAREHVGSKVLYTPSSDVVEEGVITEVRGEYVFVRYGGDYGSKATRPEDLRLLGPDAEVRMSEEQNGFAEWAIVELMGHRRLAGYIREVEIAGKGFLRLDIPTGESTATQLYNPAAVYAITPTSEDTARRVAALSQPEPVQRWELPAAVAGDTETEVPW